jgi:DNA-binding CsgD family transcriptional regulator
VVGREREQALLSEALATMLDGDGRLILITGEAGIGKTTLVGWVSQVAAHHGALTITGSCYDLTTTPPYGPWIEILRGLPVDPRQPPTPLLATDDNVGATSTAVLFERVLDVLIAARTTQPLVLVLEDLHWADPASLDLLRYLARRIRDQPLLLIGTYRDDELTRAHPLRTMLPLLVREAGATRIHVPRFDRDALEHLVAAHFDLDDAIRHDLVAYLARLSDGVPLFATELLYALTIDGRLRLADGRWQVDHLDQVQVPSLLSSIIDARLDHLDAGARHLLDVAALIGQEIELDVWMTVTAADDDALAAAIEQATNMGLLHPVAGGTRLRFTHALVRETLYHQQLLLRRRPWHRRIAEALMALPQPEPDSIAYHLEQAHDERLIDWLVRAGDRAQQRHAWLMAAARFDHAQTLLRGEQHVAERAWLQLRIGLLVRYDDHNRSLAHLDDAWQAATHLGARDLAALALAHKGLVQCYRIDEAPLHLVRQGLEDLRGGVLALEQLDDADRVEVQQVALAWRGIIGVEGRGTLALFLALVGRFHEGKALLDAWDDTSRAASADAQRATGLIAAMLGQPELARQAFERSRQHNETRGDRYQAGTDVLDELRHVQLPYAADEVDTRRKLARSVQERWADVTGAALQQVRVETIWVIECVISGEWARALELIGWAIEDWASFSRTWLTPLQLTVLWHQGKTDAVWRAIRERLPDGAATEPGGRRWLTLAELQRLAVALALDAGDLDHGRSWLEAHDRLLEWSGAVLGRSEKQLLWARYDRLQGDVSRARTHAEQALAHATDPRQPLAQIAASRFLGTLDMDERRLDVAESRLQDALMLAERCGAAFERSLSLIELARLRLLRSDIDAARQFLHVARSICESLNARPALERISQLEAALPRDIALPAGLTTRELDVLRLVARGLTDAEVAEQLFIARRTVNTHLTSIYNKLGVTSRAAATRFAVEHGLT